MNSREYPAWFIEELYLEGDKERASNGTLSSSEKVLFKCSVHGEYSQVVCNHIRLRDMSRMRGCPECAVIKRKETFIRTNQTNRPEYPDWFINELANEEDKEKARSKELVYRDKVSFICPIHNTYTQRVADHIDHNTLHKKQGCPLCGRAKQIESHKSTLIKNRPEYPDWFINELANEEDKEKARNKELCGSDKVDFLCPTHGVYNQRIDAHLDINTQSLKQGCPSCGRNKQKLSFKDSSIMRRVEYPNWFINELANEEDKEKAKNKTLTASDKVDFICEKHGVYNQIVSNHIKLSTGESLCKCPKCGAHKSYIEEEILNIVRSYCPDAESRNQATIKNNSTNRYLELDIYIPSKRIAIEYNGSVWHSDKFGKEKDYHKNKYIECEKNNIRLISIFDCDWYSNNKKIRLFLDNLLGTKEKIYGRKTIIREISNNEADEFYKQYHIKSPVSGNIVSYGLFYKETLVSAMSFSKPKFGNDGQVEWDLTRYCVKSGFSIIGGAEKLFSFFIKEHNPKRVLTYSDCDYFTGNVYKSLGFQFIKYTDSPYYWVKNDTVLKRTQCQVKILRNKYPDLYKEALGKECNSKEDYIMRALGFSKVYRTGNKRWLWIHSDII